MPIGPNTIQIREVQWPVWTCLICEAEKIAKSITNKCLMVGQRLQSAIERLAFARNA